MADQQKFNTKLKDAHVLIVGGSSGLGYAAAEASIEAGARVIISSSQQTRVKGAVDRLKAAYPSASDRITGHACNLGDENTLEQNVQDLFAKIKDRLDHIIFTAGDPLFIVSLKDASLAQIKQTGAVRFFGALVVAKYGSQHLKPGPRSSITLTTGAAGERPLPNWTIMASYLSGLHGMTRGLALDLAPIRVNLISPGGVDTELWGSMPKEARESLFKKVSETVPTGQIGQAQDVAEAYLYCMKDYNLSGSVICTNGGQLLVG